MKFSDFSTFKGVTKIHFGQFSKSASEVMDILCQEENPSKSYKIWAAKIMYTLAYKIENGDHIDNISLDTLKSMELLDEFAIKEAFKKQFIPFDDIEWDLVKVQSVTKPVVKEIPKDLMSLKPAVIAKVSGTRKEDLYLAPPRYPRFDTNKVRYAQKADYDRNSILYETLPKIPTKQNEISVTTDVDQMIGPDFLKLFPDKLIQTRKPIMYSPIEKVKFDEDIGLIIPIQGFTEKQLKDNIIKYPHLYQLKREVDGVIEPFHIHIEIDGKLEVVDEIWESLPVSKLIPKTTEFVSEYVARRYLLERDIKHIKHTYPILGGLEPFLTLFAPADFYTNRGYKDIEELGKQCVKSRVSYRYGRNGVLKNSGVDRCIFSSYCIQPECKLVCPIYQQTDYLLSQNDIAPPNPIYSADEDMYKLAESILDKHSEGFHVIENASPNEFAKILTYCAICDNWKGSKFSMSVYHLKFSKYVERTRASWSMREEPDDLQYMKIWAQNAKVLIISNADYVSYGDVECQTLLQLVQDRDLDGKITIFVCKNTSKLIGRSSFFSVFKEIVEGAKDR